MATKSLAMSVSSTESSTDNIEDIIQLLLTHLPTEGKDEGDLAQLNQLKDILTKSLTKVNEKIKLEEKKKVIDVSTDNDSVILHLTNTQFIEPRGKFDVHLSEDYFLISGSIGSFKINWNEIKQIILLPNPTPIKKDAEKYLFIILQNFIQIKTKKVSILCWQLNNTGPSLTAQYGPIHFNGKESNVVSDVIQSLYSHPICHPNSARFQTSTGLSFLRCYKGVQEGVLFPLEEGILFFKPSIFISSKNVSSITAGRGGSAQTRYIDLKIETDDDKTYEYSNIDREELPAIERYVQYYAEQRKIEERKMRDLKRGMASHSSNSTGLVDEENEEDEDDEEEEEDEDFDPNAPESSDEERNKSDGSGSEEDSDADEDDEDCSGDDEDEDEDLKKKSKNQKIKKIIPKKQEEKKKKRVVVVSLDDESEGEEDNRKKVAPKSKKSRME